MKQILIFTVKWKNSIGKNDLSNKNLCRYIKDPFQENAVNISGDEWNQVITLWLGNENKDVFMSTIKDIFSTMKKKNYQKPIDKFSGVKKDF